MCAQGNSKLMNQGNSSSMYTQRNGVWNGLNVNGNSVLSTQNVPYGYGGVEIMFSQISAVNTNVVRGRRFNGQRKLFFCTFYNTA